MHGYPKINRSSSLEEDYVSVADEYKKWMKGPLPEMGAPIQWEKQLVDAEEGKYSVVVIHTRFDSPSESHAVAYREEWRIPDTGEVIQELQGLFLEDKDYRSYLFQSNTR